jgi:pimeloyl-ACP methyl ester carboxylesterase
MTLPSGALPQPGWPVAIYAHGTGGDFHTFVEDGTAALLAAQGIACISIDQVLHGERNTELEPDVAFFNYQNPAAARDNPVQAAADNFQLVRLAEGLDTIDQGTGRPLDFDDQRILFIGHSQGSLTGLPFVANEPSVETAVFSGAGALLYLALLEKTEPIDIPGLLALFIRDQPLDAYHPVINLLQAFMERSDAATYSRALTDETSGKNLLVTQGFVDHYTPAGTTFALARSLGVDVAGQVVEEVAELSLAGGHDIALPVTDNRGARTRVLLQYPAEAGSDGHFVLFDSEVAQFQVAGFVGSWVQTGSATVPRY